MKEHAQHTDQSRAAAHHTGSGSKGFPAVSPVQRYADTDFHGVPARVSDDGNMVVEQTGKATNFLAKDPAQVADNAVEPQLQRYDYTLYVNNSSLKSNCEAFALSNWHKIFSFVQGEQTAKREFVNVPGTPGVDNDYQAAYNHLLSGEAMPGVGEAYYVINNPLDPDIDKGHLRLHWAVVVAKSGNDVITNEASDDEEGIWFQMYSQSDAEKNFKAHYVSAKKLVDTAKLFQVKFSAINTPPKKIYYDDEVL
jgi:hypothetical protein